MKVTIAENRLEVLTGIKKADFDKKVTDMVVTDDKGNITFALDVTTDPYEAEISKLGLTCNTVIEGELAVTMIIPIGKDVEEVKTELGMALVNAKAGLETLVERIKADTEAVDELFPVEGTETPVEAEGTAEA